MAIKPSEYTTLYHPLSLSRVYFGPNDVAVMLGVQAKTIQYWCKNDKITANKVDDLGEWSISAKNLASFLYYNPRYQASFRNHVCYGSSKAVHDAILQDIDVRPTLYSAHDLSGILGVHRDTIKKWIQNKKIKPLSIRSTYGDDLFTKEGIEAFIELCPRYKKKYEKWKDWSGLYDR